jgi:hypothetical protein
MSEALGHTGGRGPNCGGVRSRGERLMYEDLDCPLSSDWPLLFDSVIGFGPKGPSSSPKRTKYANVNEKNPNWSLREYTQFARPIAMKYYAYRSMDMLELDFFNNSMDGYVELCKYLCQEFMCKFDNSKKFNAQALKRAMGAYAWGVWYGYHQKQRSLKYHGKGLKMDTKRYDGYEM